MVDCCIQDLKMLIVKGCMNVLECRVAAILKLQPLPPSSRTYAELAALLNGNPDFEDSDRTAILGKLSQRIAWADQLGGSTCDILLRNKLASPVATVSAG